MIKNVGLFLYYTTRIFDLLISKFWSFSLQSFLHKKSKFVGSVYVAGYGRFILVDNLTIGNNVHINSGAYWVCDGGLTIGDNCHFARNCVIYTRNHNYNGEALPYDTTNINKPVFIGNNVWIGINVVILPGAQIGDGAIIGAGSVVHGNVPELSIYGANNTGKVAERDKEHYQRVLKSRKFSFGAQKIITYSSSE